MSLSGEIRAGQPGALNDSLTQAFPPFRRLLLLAALAEVDKMDNSEKSSLAPSLPAPLAKRPSRLGSWVQSPSRCARWTRVFLSIIAPMLVVVALGVGIGWRFRTQPFNTPPAPDDFDGRELTVRLVLQSVDPLLNGGTINIYWTILDDNCFDSDSNPSDTPDPEHCPPVNIYMEPSGFAGVTVTPTTTASNTIPSNPVYVLLPSTDWRADYATFTTSLAIGLRKYQASDTLLNYPFDKYVTEIFAYAEVNGTGDPVALTVADATGVAFGFDVYVPTAAQLLKEYGINISNSEVQEGPAGSLDLILDIERTVLVRAYVVTIVVAMWVITLLLLAISVKAAFFMYNVDMTILAAPVATLFAFTTLRTALPGAPSGFGAIIDFVGTLPSLAVLICITVICLLHVLIRSTRKITRDSEA